jgi:hypothetical protein
MWVVAIIAGLVQSIAERFYIEPDGVNYLDIAYAYLRHDFHNAVNGYWSPLYSWLMALAIVVTHTPAYWESTVLHSLNFLIYLLSLVCFAFFFRELTMLTSEQHGIIETKSLPRLAWNLFGYSLFVYASLELIRLGTDTPDMLVSTACFLATGILLRMRRGVTGWSAYVALGGVLALGYLAKAVMFPISFVFLFSSSFAAGNWRRTAPRAALALVTFLSVASPWLFSLSKAKGGFTFGDTGRLNYAWYVNGEGTPLHGIRRLAKTPPIEEFATPVAGTYPPWYDHSYWNEGLRPHFAWRRQLHAISTNLSEYFRLLSAEKGIAVGLLVLILFSSRPGAYGRSFMELWPFWLPAIATIGLYALVHVETRFLGAAVVVLWCSLFAAVRLPRSPWSEHVWASCLIAVSVAFGVTLAAECIRDLFAIVRGQENVEYQVAQELTRHGVQKGDSVAVLGHSNIADYWAHLAQVRIVADVPAEGVSSFWDANVEARRSILKLFSQSGAHALITRIPPPSSQTDWQSLGSTGYYIIVLPRSTALEEGHKQ